MTEINSFFHNCSNDDLAIQSTSESLTYFELYKRVSQIFSALKSNGIKECDKVLLKADPSVETVATLLALLYNRNQTALINPNDKGESLQRKINLFQPDHIYNISISDQSTDLLKLPDKLFLNTLATVIFSSGSTSDPKGIVHTLGNHYYSALGSNENIEINKTDKYLLSLPLFHVSGLAIIFRSLIASATIVLSDNSLSLSNAIEKFKITHISVVPAQLSDLINSDISKLRSLKAILVGGDAVPKKLIESAYELNLPIYTTYGMTETSSQLTTTAPNDSLEHLFTSGKILPHRKITITDTGEILAGGKTIFHSYLNSSDCKSDDSFFHTSDLGYLDNDGYLHVTGRKDNMFISGGENIYPEEIEKALLELDVIKNAIVLPKDDTRFGKVPVAFIEWVDKEYDLEYIKELLKANLPPHKIVKAIHKMPDDIQNLSIKINRKKLSDYLKSN